MPFTANQKGKTTYILMYCGKMRLAQILTCLVVKMDFIPPSNWISDYLKATERAFFANKDSFGNKEPFGDKDIDQSNSILFSEILLSLVKVGIRIPDAWLDSALDFISFQALGGAMTSGEAVKGSMSRGHGLGPET